MSRQDMKQDRPTTQDAGYGSCRCRRLPACNPGATARTCFLGSSVAGTGPSSSANAGLGATASVTCSIRGVLVDWRQWYGLSQSGGCNQPLLRVHIMIRLHQPALVPNHPLQDLQLVYACAPA